ncbi:MAG TPA: PhzF family phenazine biosynthesis isomerase [Candidatus Eisenbacteria bacterium]|nr:PhzF family phenazine biosynthesis isomerase [Candidatus Eisenbacteria bacterium]
MSRTSFHAAIVDAFTRRAGEGNRAGVVPDAGRMSEAMMQAAAHAVGASETAFVMAPCDGAHLRLRYFTPTAEIEFCGHATVATFHRLVEMGTLEAPGTYQLDTEAGIVEVELERDGEACRVWIVTPRHAWNDSPLEPAELMRLLGGTPPMLDSTLPIRSSGSKLFVPIRRRADLWSLTPRWDELTAAGLARELRGFYVFTREAADPAHVTQGRYFAPAVGVREDPATGSASGPLAEYLALHGVLALPEAGGDARACAEQGDAMGKPGRLQLEVRGTREGIARARVGGTAVTVMDGTLFVSDAT